MQRVRCRLATAELLKRHGVQPSKQSAAELEAAQGGGSEDEGDDGSMSGSGEEPQAESGEDDAGSEGEADEPPAEAAEADDADGRDSDGSGQDAELDVDVSGGGGRTASQPDDALDKAGSRGPPATDAAERSKVSLPITCNAH